MNSLKKKITDLIASASLRAKSYSEMTSCSLFAFEPELPEEEEEEEIIE